ncbi:MAG: PGPGW domain-containing protein [Ignavibacteriales bacterium]|nr:PGPGW domain-containing protein [Ignavibacteriales bacterium]
MISQGWRKIRRFVVAVVGTTVLLVGIALIFLPGPAFILIPAGIAILAIEFPWAKRLIGRIREKAGSKTAK